MNAEQLLAAMRSEDLAALEQEPPKILARALVALRRQTIGVLGDGEAFRRRGPRGELVQVTQRVTLSEVEGDLIRIGKRKPYMKGTNEEIADYKSVDRSRVEWRTVQSMFGTLTYQGFQKLNAVCGCQVVRPPEVVVDGKKRANPHIEYTKTASGSALGAVRRIVVSVAVVGAAPGTGNLVVSQYVLDYDPAKELLQMLGGLTEKPGAGVHLETEEDARAAKRAWLEVFAGVGYGHDLKNAEVKEAYSQYVQMLGNAARKASTVASRNAMKSHPALGPYARVAVDANGIARVAVTGWVLADAEREKAWQATLDTVQRGLPLPEHVKLVTDTGTYDADPLARVEDRVEAEVITVDDDGIDPELVAAHQRVEQGLAMLPREVVDRIDYDVDGDVAHCQRVLSIINAELDRLEAP